MGDPLLFSYLKQVQLDVTAEYPDLVEPGDWQRHFESDEVVVLLPARKLLSQVSPKHLQVIGAGMSQVETGKAHVDGAVDP